MDIDTDLLYFINQQRVDDYYRDKKQEVGQWVTEYVENQKKITEEQRKRLLTYASQISFTTAGEINAYVQNLNTVSKREKEKLENYMQKIDWLPEGENMGHLDGVLVSRVLESPLEKLLGDKEWKSKKE